MAALAIGQFAPGSPEWVAARRNRVGGSEAAVCLGISPFESLFSLWHRKANMIGPIDQTPLLEWGNRLEDAVLAKWEDDHGDDRASNRGRTYVSDTHPFMVANPDSVTAHGDIVEVKTSPYGDGWGPAGSDVYPVYYRAQVLHYMHVLDVQRAWLVVLISGYDYREYQIEMNETARAEVDMIIQAEQAFIHSLPGGPNERRPSIDEHDATYQTLRELHPEIDAGETVELGADVASPYLDACQAVKDAEATKRKHASLVLDAMGSAQYATYNGDRIASRQTRGDGNPYLVAARTKQTRKAA